MRKDAKIGFAIGGVLLAVLTVYVIVVPRHHNLSPNAVTLTMPTDMPPGDSASGGTDNSSAKPAAGSDTLAKNTSADGVNWEKLLNGGAGPGDTAPPLMVSNTPGSGDSATVPGTATPGNTTSAKPPVALVDNNTKPAGPATRPATPLVVDPPAPNTRLAVKGTKQYTIKSGQTLSSIAGEVYGNSRFYVAILRANPGLNPNRLKPGDKITLPDAAEVNPEVSSAAVNGTGPIVERTAASNGRTYTVKAGDTLYAISKELFGTPRQASAIYDLNKQTIGPNEARLKQGMVLKLPETPATPVAVVR